MSKTFGLEIRADSGAEQYKPPRPRARPFSDHLIELSVGTMFNACLHLINSS